MIQKEYTLLEVVEKYPNTEDIFRRYNEGAGAGVLCHNLFDSLEEFADKMNEDLEKLLDDLNSVKE